jgi:hypothetical protein
MCNEEVNRLVEGRRTDEYVATKRLNDVCATNPMFWRPRNAKCAIKEGANPVIKYKVVALLTQVHVFLLMF